MSTKLVAELTDKLEQVKARAIANREQAKRAAENVATTLTTFAGGAASGACRHYLEQGYIPGTEIEADLAVGVLAVAGGFAPRKYVGDAQPFLRSFGAGLLAGWASHMTPRILER